MLEAHQHGRPRYRPAATPLNWEGPCPYLLQKLYHVRPGIFEPTFYVALLTCYLLHQAVLGLAVHSQ